MVQNDFSADIFSVRVPNRTTPLQSRCDRVIIAHRLALRENHHNQRALIRVVGNVPDHNLICKR